MGLSNLKETSNIDDAWSVFCKRLKKWVIENNFITIL